MSLVQVPRDSFRFLVVTDTTLDKNHSVEGTEELREVSRKICMHPEQKDPLDA